MIYTIRGTNGSGKSTIVHRLLEEYGTYEQVWSDNPNRRRPDALILISPWYKDVVVIGHYKIQNGGMDTLKDLDYCYNLALKYHLLGYDVIMEGKNMSDSVDNLSIFSPKDVCAIFLNTPLDVCIASVRDRGHNIQEKTIVSIFRKMNNQRLEMIDLHYKVKLMDREEAYEFLLSELQP